MRDGHDKENWEINGPGGDSLGFYFNIIRVLSEVRFGLKILDLSSSETLAYHGAMQQEKLDQRFIFSTSFSQ